MEYYVVKSKETGLYFRGKGANRWGKYFNQASIYRMKAKAEETARWLSKGDENCEVKVIRIIED